VYFCVFYVSDSDPADAGYLIWIMISEFSKTWEWSCMKLIVKSSHNNLIIQLH